jgi:indole-3-glycerol phosphate synthase
MPTKLDEILAHTLEVVAERKAAADRAFLEARAAEHTPRGFAEALRTTSATGPAVIAEIKKASPSKGLIRADFDPVALARTFELAGAAALSILTDEKFFQGSLTNLLRASGAVSIPCLRKDFILDPFQILEARASGADAILLIVAALTDAQLIELRDTAQAYSLDVLCETHSRQEMDRALNLGFSLIGVNSRDLRTFDVRPALLFELAKAAPAGTLLVAESGIRTEEDVARLRDAGYRAFLIGESLMRQPDPAAALATLVHRDYTPLTPA